MGGIAIGVRRTEHIWPAVVDLRFFRKLPWYSAEIEEITPQAQELFEKYSHVESDHVKAHIKELVRNGVVLTYLAADELQRDKAYLVVSDN